MIRDPVLLDTGPLVALLNRQDSLHKVCRDQAAEITGPVFTTWAVLTEAAWILRTLPNSLERLLQTIEGQNIDCQHLDATAMPWLKKCAVQYQNLNPQLADLTLLYLAKQHQIQHVFTLDRRDFLVYRTPEGKPFRLLPPQILT